MSYIDEIFERTNLQNIREFLMNDVSGTIETQSYMDRINTAEKHMIKHLKDYTSQHEYEGMITSIYDYAGAGQNVYMEIGMQCGARLAAQLLAGHKTS